MDAFQTISLILDVLAGVLGAWGLSLLWRSGSALRRRGVAVCPQCAAEVAGDSPTACDKCGGKIPKRRWPARRRRAGVMDLVAGIVAAVLALGVLIGSAYAESWAKDQFQPIDWWLALAKLGVWSLGAGALWLVVSGLVGQRSGGKPHCHKCWYLMEGVPDLTCPECGKVAASKRELFRSKRKWKRVLVGGAMLPVLVYGIWMSPRVQKGGWVGAVPTWVLIWQMERMPSEWLVDGRYREHDLSLAGRLVHDDTSPDVKRWALNRGLQAAMATNDLVRGEVYSDVASAGTPMSSWGYPRRDEISPYAATPRTLTALWDAAMDASRPRDVRVGALMWIALIPMGLQGREADVLTLLDDPDDEILAQAMDLVLGLPATHEAALPKIKTRVTSMTSQIASSPSVARVIGELSAQEYPEAIELVQWMLAQPGRHTWRAGLLAVNVATHFGNEQAFIATLEGLIEHGMPDAAFEAAVCLARMRSYPESRLIESIRANVRQPGQHRTDWITLLSWRHDVDRVREFETMMEMSAEAWDLLTESERAQITDDLSNIAWSDPAVRTKLGDMRWNGTGAIERVAKAVDEDVRRKDEQ